MGFMTNCRQFIADESGISSVEYALMLAFLAGSIAVTAGELGFAVSNEISEAGDCVEDNSTCGN